MAPVKALPIATVVCAEVVGFASRLLFSHRALMTPQTGQPMKSPCSAVTKKCQKVAAKSTKMEGTTTLGSSKRKEVGLFMHFCIKLALRLIHNFRYKWKKRNIESQNFAVYYDMKNESKRLKIFPYSLSPGERTLQRSEQLCIEIDVY